MILPLLLLAGGCSTFNRDWKRAAANPVPANDIQGRWDGRWLSEVNGHNGRLRCLVSQSSPGKYEARFHAKYRKILSFGYTVVLNVQRTNDLFTFQGEADLGWLAGGQYFYSGRATPTNFFSTYRSKHDHGIFEMTRP
ncbi:MAG: hypothetical protein FJ403_00420 [Verrucomicrobia bacterium]|nr:hypothetical protein [Verrucomicrobiota bacterium]